MPTSPRNVAILIFDDVEVLDYAGPFEVFNVTSEALPRKPMPVFFTYTVGLTENLVVTRGGMRVTPHFSLETCPQPDILLIPGGFGVRRLVYNPRLIAWVQEQAPRLELLLSVCTGALVLAQAGLLAGCPATTHHSAFDMLRTLSPTTTVVEDQRYVFSTPRIATSGGISAGIDLALHVVERLLGPDAAAPTRKEMEWGWHGGGR